MCECCKLVGVCPCGLGIREMGVGVPLVYECCKLLGGTPWGLGVVGWGQGSLY